MRCYNSIEPQMTTIHDILVVGSGPSGAQAAQTLAEAGVKVTMLDVGFKDEKYVKLVPENDFLSIRENEHGQHRYFLGDDFESISLEKTSVGPQLTPPRNFLIEQVNKLLPLDSDTFQPMESLAYGGLGSGWVVGCSVFSKAELGKTGMDYFKMQEAYQVVCKRIGISAAKDDASPYTIGSLTGCQYPHVLDSNSAHLYDKYQKKKRKLNSQGFYLGRPALALLTENLGDRCKTLYNDMDFYSDKSSSAYRPWLTIEKLKQAYNFNYINHRFVLSFKISNGAVEVMCLNTDSYEKEIFTCKKLILASGVLGTARIVLRSINKENIRLPIISNPFCYVPCIQPKLIGRETEKKRMSFAQLVMFHDWDGTNSDVAVAALHSYRSLLLFKAIKEAPLNYQDSRIIMQYLQSGISIAGIHQPETGSEHKYIELVKDHNSVTGDKLKAHYSHSNDEKIKFKIREKKYMKALRSLNCYPLRKIHLNNGSSIHYGGTLPFSMNAEPYTLSPDGRLSGFQNVFAADGSGFKYLPAKGITFSLMANAHNVAKNVLKND